MVLRPFAVALVLLTAPFAYAAEATDVPDAADGDDPFDAHVSLRFDYTYQRALITRENTQISEHDQVKSPRTVDVRELDYQRHTIRLRPRIEVGIFHDLSAFFEWPIVVRDQQNTSFANGTDATNSTLARDMNGPVPTIEGWRQTRGSADGSYDQERFGFPNRGYNEWNINPADGSFESVRAQFDYPTLGVRWSPLNNERDPSKPTITLQVDYNLGILPLPVANPTDDTPTSDEPASVAKGLHEFHFHVGMSKRWLLLDPYFLVDYWLPFGATNAYPGFQPRHRGGFTFGMEVVAYENPKLDQKVAIDLSAVTHYLSEGRDYSEMSDALGELTYVGQSMRMGGNVGVYLRAFEFAYIDVTGSALYDTEHFLTSESIGKDGENNNGVVDLDPNEKERSVYFNPALDTPGRRLKVEDSVHLQVMVHAALTF